MARRSHFLLVLPWAALACSDGAVTDTDVTTGARCPVRVAIALTGLAPDAELLEVPDPTPPAQIARLIASDAFRARFAGFMAAGLNDGASAASDVTYALAHHVLERGLPWTQLFTGAFAIGTDLAVSDAETGLGYFHDPVWRSHYAGSEPEGYQLRAAYRILNNVLGVTRTIQVQNATSGQAVRNIRETAECAGCHFDAQYGLDRVAGLLPRRTSAPAMSPTTFEATAPSPGGELLFKSVSADGPFPDGVMIASDVELLGTMVTSAQFRWNACRQVFHFLYARDESQHEAPAFDACLDVMESTGVITDAVQAVVTHPTFCE